MLLNKPFARIAIFKTALLLACSLLVQSLGIAQSTPSAQEGQTTSLAPAATSPSSTPPSTDLLWSNLSAEKQQSLLPLQNIWPLLSEKHQRKWLALAQNFPKMSPEEKNKLHSRMVDWAALNPKERELARLNFAETKKMSPEERAANWEAYQALSPDERKELADKALSKKAKSGAPSIKTTNNQKLTAIPPRRTAPESLRALMRIQNPVDANTLLPVRNPQVPAP